MRSIKILVDQEFLIQSFEMLIFKDPTDISNSLMMYFKGSRLYASKDDVGSSTIKLAQMTSM